MNQKCYGVVLTFAFGRGEKSTQMFRQQDFCAQNFPNFYAQTCLHIDFSLFSFHLPAAHAGGFGVRRSPNGAYRDVQTLHTMLRLFGETL